MSRRIIRLFLASLALAALFAGPVAEAAHPIYRASPEGPALAGYDTVAYFTLGQAVRGKPEFRTKWQDTLWYFVSEAHQRMFEADPARYAPQFGGYCAYAASKRRLYEGNPEVFSIEDGKLYFNNNRSVMQRWLQQRDTLIDAAESIFPRIVDRAQSRPRSEHGPVE